MRILLITQLFDPENAIKGLSFAKGLVSRGHEVEVITTFPSYPGGRIYPGFRMRWRQIEEIDGVRIVRIPSYITHNRSGLKRMLGYSSFSLNAFLYSLFFIRRPDVIYFYYPPIVGGVPAILLSFFQRCPMIYDVQDLWPEALVATGMVRSNSIVSIIEHLAGWIYKHSRAIIVLSDGYKEALIKKGVPADKVFRVYNWCDESRILKECTQTPPLDDSGEWFDVVYAGNLGAAQALEAVVKAADLLQRWGDNKIRFVFIGDGLEKETLSRLATSLDLHNVLFRDRTAPEEIGAVLRLADALLVHLANDPVFDITIPSKTQAYLALGKPILMAVSGESADIVRRSCAGVVAIPSDAESIALGALQLARSTQDQLAAFGAAGQSYYHENMSQQNGIEQTVMIMEKIRYRA